MSLKSFAMVLVLVFGLIAVPVHATKPSEASGQVLDQDGNPIKGASVTFVPQANPSMQYSGKTNKKGRYYVAGLYTPKEGDNWDVTVEADGYLVAKVHIVLRTVNRVLIDEYDIALGVGKRVPPFPIRPLGTATVDFTMGDRESMEASASAPVAPQPGAAGQAEQAAAEPARDPWQEALNLAGAGDLAGAATALDEAVEDEPEDAERRETYAKILLQLGRADEALAQADKAVALEPDRIDSRMILFKIHDENGDLDQAKSVLEGALEAAPGDARILKRLAYVAGKQGDAQASIAAYESLVENHPQDKEAWLALGSLYDETGARDKSSQAFQHAIDLDPDNAYRTYYNLGVLLIDKPNRSDSETRRAIDAFRKAVEIKPDYGQAYQQMAYAQIGIGDQAGALASLKAYVSLDPPPRDADRMRKLIGTLQK